ncbi:MAG TPA: hypothetical protein VNR20_00995, partial [Terriglobales bacterium]|nr:hypothetical protein [Terriglobales bacterium]
TTSTTTTTTTTTPASTTPAKKKMGVNARQARQQQRIGEGVENGSLTAGEAAKLENKETKLNKEEARFSKSGGQLTPAEKAKLEKQENTLSKDIDKQKHDAQAQNTDPKSEIGKRDREQQKRIGEGIENGSLTAKEAGKLETKEAKLNKQEKQMRADGDMTQKEKTKVNREQNHLSKDIYMQKHDKQRRRK